jgi:hypothetical protein
VYRLATENFWLSFDTPHYPLVTKFLRSPKKRHVICLWKPFIIKRGVWKNLSCCKVDDRKLLVATRLKIFNCRQISDQNPFSITIYNEGCLSVNIFFLMSILIDLIDTTYMSRQTLTWHLTLNGCVMSILTTLI